MMVGESEDEAMSAGSIAHVSCATDSRADHGACRAPLLSGPPPSVVVLCWVPWEQRPSISENKSGPGWFLNAYDDLELLDRGSRRTGGSASVSIFRLFVTFSVQQTNDRTKGAARHKSPPLAARFSSRRSPISRLLHRPFSRESISARCTPTASRSAGASAGRRAH